MRVTRRAMTAGERKELEALDAPGVLGIATGAVMLCLLVAISLFSFRTAYGGWQENKTLSVVAGLCGIVFLVVSLACMRHSLTGRSGSGIRECLADGHVEETTIEVVAAWSLVGDHMGSATILLDRDGTLVVANPKQDEVRTEFTLVLPCVGGGKQWQRTAGERVEVRAGPSGSHADVILDGGDGGLELPVEDIDEPWRSEIESVRRKLCARS